MRRSRVINSQSNPTTIPRLTFPRGSMVAAPRPQTAYAGAQGTASSGLPGVSGTAGGIRSPFQVGLDALTGNLNLGDYRQPSGMLGVRGYNSNVRAEPMRPIYTPPTSGHPGGYGAPNTGQVFRGPAVFGPKLQTWADFTKGTPPDNPLNAMPIMEQGRPMSPYSVPATAGQMGAAGGENWRADPMFNISNLNDAFLTNDASLLPGSITPEMMAYAQSKGIDLSKYYNPDMTLKLELQSAGQGTEGTPGAVSKDQYGNTIIEGTPTTKDIGTTPAGTEQYARIQAGLSGDKWRVVTRQDANGNWVRSTTYAKHNRGRRGGGGAPNQGGDISGIGLVNFNTSTG